MVSHSGGMSTETMWDLSRAQTLQVIYLRLDFRMACDGLQQKFQHAEYVMCNPLISHSI